jgi:hypothetical protein
MNNNTLLAYLATPRTLEQISRRFYYGRITGARHDVRALIWAGQVKFEGGHYVARTPTPDYAWVAFQAAYLAF